MASLPYVTAPGNVDRALLGIKQAATPPTVSHDFVKTILGIKGGSGNQMTAYRRKKKQHPAAQVAACRLSRADV
jgi:hypothetical protein